MAESSAHWLTGAFFDFESKVARPMLHIGDHETRSSTSLSSPSWPFGCARPPSA